MSFQQFTLPEDKTAPKTQQGDFLGAGSFLQKKYETENAQKVETKIPSLKERLSQAVTEGMDKVQASQDRENAGKQNKVSTLFQEFGAGLKTAADVATSPISLGLDYVGEAIKKGREHQKEMDDQAIANGTLDETHALSRKPHIEDQLAELVNKGMNTETAGKIRDIYDGLSPEAKANVNSLGDILSGGFDIGTLGVGKKAVETTGKKIVEKAAKNTAEREAKIVADQLLESTGKKVTSKETQTALDNILPTPDELSKADYEDLVARGRIAPKTLKSPASYIPNEEEIKTASKYKSLLQSKEPIENAANIKKLIIDNDAEVGAFLQKQPYIYNDGELKNYLAKKLEPIDDLTVDEARLAKLKKQTIDNFIKGLPKNNMEQLWKSRKEFDRTIEKAFSGSPTLQKEIKKEFRNGVQDFIADHTTDTVYKDKMKEMSNLYNLQDNVLAKASKEKNVEGRIAKWIKDNPTKAKALGLVGTAAVGKTAYDFFAY